MVGFIILLALIFIVRAPWWVSLLFGIGWVIQQSLLQFKYDCDHKTQLRKEAFAREKEEEAKQKERWEKQAKDL